MKKILFLAITVLAAFTLAGCSELGNNEDKLVSEIGSEESLATLSYLSAGFLDFSNEAVVLSNTTFLSNKSVEEETTIEGELDEVNIYVDRLKGLIDNGVDGFGSVAEEPSDNELYTYKLTFTVNEETYIIYYNIDDVTSEMTGIILVGEVEYDFEVMDNMKEYKFNDEEKNENKRENSNSNKTDDENDQEEELEQDEMDTEDSDEVETKMILIATNGTDTIKIIYKTEVEEDESTVKFYVEQVINGVEKRITLKINEEDNDTKVTVTDGEDSYSFKRNVEEDGVVYMLHYEVDGVKGMVRITEIVAEDGTITYDYFIQEAGREKHMEKQEPKSNGFDDDDDDDDEQEEDDSEV